MSIFRTHNLESLSGFANQGAQLAIAERKALTGADNFFSSLMQEPFRAIGIVYKNTEAEDIKYILENEIPNQIQQDAFYEVWISDMAKICSVFCDTLNDDSIGFCLGTQRGCKRYHIDNVPMRLLVTYAGQGTEWLPDEAVNKNALSRHGSNDEIIKDPSARRFMNPWDVSIFRGGPKGLLHRTPDSALQNPSILMRLDHSSFWTKIIEKD